MTSAESTCTKVQSVVINSIFLWVVGSGFAFILLIILDKPIIFLPYHKNDEGRPYVSTEAVINIKDSKNINQTIHDILFVKKNLIDYISSPLTIDFSAKRYDDLCFKTPGPEHLKGISINQTTHQYFMRNPSIFLTMKKELNLRARIDRTLT